jgi:probable addiction module antidote protein
MVKKKTSRKQPFCLNNMPISKSKNTPLLLKHNTRDFFKAHQKVALALLSSLEEGDPKAFLEILNAYLDANRTQVSKDTKLSRTTVQNALSKKGNPTISTIAKIVHHAVA